MFVSVPVFDSVPVPVIGAVVGASVGTAVGGPGTYVGGVGGAGGAVGTTGVSVTSKKRCGLSLSRKACTH